MVSRKISINNIFVFMDSILWDISNRATYILLNPFERGLIPYTLLDFIEGWKVIPLYPHMKYLINFLFTPLKPSLYNLDENVCFIETENVRFRMSCDWCSLINGIVETAKQNIINRPELAKQIDFGNLMFSEVYLDFILSGRNEKVTHEQGETWCRDMFGQATPDL